MGSNMSRKDDEYKANMKTAKLLSRSEEEDGKARQEIDKEKFDTAIKLSLKEKGKTKREDQKQAVNPPVSISDTGGGRSVNPQDLSCHLCHGPFALDETPKKGKYHKHCYEEDRNSICYVCKILIRLTETKERRMHPFWKEKYCSVHDSDGTSKCCSCERLEPRGEATYVMLDDYRWLCLECMKSSVMDSIESVPLLEEIRDFFESKALIFKKRFPLLLVEKEALNKAETYEEEGESHPAVITRGLCLSEVQRVSSIITRPIGRGPNNRLIGMLRKVQEVNGILILYGLPRLLTGYILAHEMMHAWLRQNGYRKLKLELEEGLCQVLALMWLESHTFAFTEAEAASSSSSSRTPLATTTSKKGDAWSDFEKRFVEFCISQIKEDESPVYGQGFKVVYRMMRSNGYSITDTLKEIVLASKAVPDTKF